MSPRRGIIRIAGRRQLARWLLGLTLALATGGIALGPRSAQGVDLALSPTAVATPVSSPDPEHDPNVSLTQIQLGDQVAHGSRPSLDVWFPGSGDYELADGSFLLLRYEHSPLLRPEDSTLTVLLNDAPLSSVFLDAGNAAPTQWRIPLPRDKLARDSNHVELSLAQHLRDELHCADDDNPALFTRIYADSALHYEYASPRRFLPLPPPDLGRFPEPFLRATRPAGQVTVVVPDQPSPTDLTAAASVAARFGQVAGTRQLSLTLRSASQVDERARAAGDLVLVGRPDANPLIAALGGHLPLALGDVAGQPPRFAGLAGADEPGSGVLQALGSPWDPRYAVLVVSGSDDAGLGRATRAFASRVGGKAIGGAYAVVLADSAGLAQAGATVGEARTSFRQLGLTDWEARGIGSHTRVVTFDASPPDPQGGAYLDLTFSHSPLVFPGTSSLAVRLNGASVSSILLSPDDPVEVHRRVALPSGALRPGVNSLELAFNLYPNRADDCGPPAPERAWGVLAADSALVVPPAAEPPAPDLASFAYPFVKGGTPEPALLVLPDDLTQLGGGLAPAFAIGRQSLGNSAVLSARLASQLTPDERAGHNLVVYGLATGNSVVAELASRLPVALDAEQRRSVQQSGVLLLEFRDEPDLALIELIPSPSAAGRFALVVSGSSPTTLSLAGRALDGQLPSGNVALLSEQQGIVGLKLASPPEPAVQPPRPDWLYGFGAMPPVLVGLVLLGVMAISTGRAR